jgi:hypothetical protein
MENAMHNSLNMEVYIALKTVTCDTLCNSTKACITPNKEERKLTAVLRNKEYKKSFDQLPFVVAINIIHGDVLDRNHGGVSQLQFMLIARI